MNLPDGWSADDGSYGPNVTLVVFDLGQNLVLGMHRHGENVLPDSLYEYDRINSDVILDRVHPAEMDTLLGLFEEFARMQPGECIETELNIRFDTAYRRLGFSVTPLVADAQGRVYVVKAAIYRPGDQTSA